MTKYRLGILGAGQITRNSHLPAALACPEIEVTGLIDPVEARASQLAADFGIAPSIAGDISQLKNALDGVIVATPNHTHRSAAIACMESGADVLVEKPLAATFEEGRAIVECAERLGRVVAVGYTTRFRRSTRLLKTLLDRGYFGEVRRFVHQFGTPGGWAPLSAYNLDRATAGGGVLVVTGTHFLDRMLAFWGYPDTVALEDDSQGGPEANCTARFTYMRNGHILHGMARYSKTVQLRNGLVIDTEAGHVVITDAEDAEVILRPREHPDLEHRLEPLEADAADGRNAFQLQLEDFVHASRTRGVPEVDGRQGLESMRLIEQLYATRRSVDIDWYSTPHTLVLQ